MEKDDRLYNHGIVIPTKGGVPRCSKCRVCSMKHLCLVVTIIVVLLVSGVVFAEIDYSKPIEGNADFAQWKAIPDLPSRMKVEDLGDNSYLLSVPSSDGDPWSGVLVPGCYEDFEVSFRCKTDSENSVFLAVHVRATKQPGEPFVPWWPEAGYGFQINGNGTITFTKKLGQGKLMGEIGAVGVFGPGFTEWRTITIKATGGFDGTPVVIEARVDGELIEFKDANGNRIDNPLTEKRGEAGCSMAIFNWGANWWVADFQIKQL